MTLTDLAQRHVERLTAAIGQAREAAQAHAIRAQECESQARQLESERDEWARAGAGETRLNDDGPAGD